MVGSPSYWVTFLMGFLIGLSICWDSCVVASCFLVYLGISTSIGFLYMNFVKAYWTLYVAIEGNTIDL